MITIEHANINYLTKQEIEQIHQLMVQAYAATETEIWGNNYVRIELDAFIDLLKNSCIQLARLHGEIVGSIATTQIDKESYGFGLLNVHASKSGKGIGKMLIEASESFALKKGAKYMKIEILRPSNLEVPQKVMLAKWYASLGYKFVKSMRFEDLKVSQAEKALKLIAPAHFDCYIKSLRP